MNAANVAVPTSPRGSFDVDAIRQFPIRQDAENFERRKS